MSIEFHCTICRRLLRVPDGTSGRQARCPGCGGLLIVPADVPSEPAGTSAGNESSAGIEGRAALPETLWAAPPSPFAAGATPTSPFFGGPAAVAPDSDNPYASPSTEAMAARPISVDVCAYAASQVQTPAVGLIIVGVLGLLGTVLLGFGAVFGAFGQGGGPGLPFELGGIFGMLVIMAAASVLLIYGGTKMKRLENYSVALAASIVALLPILGCCGYGCGCSSCLGLVFGIWGLVVLSNAQVRAAFDQVAGARRASRHPTSEPPRSTGP
jgi:hypothetical protein